MKICLGLQILPPSASSRLSRQCANHPATLGMAKRTGKKSVGNPMARKENGEIVVMSGMDAITSINQSRVKVDIGIQLATHKVLVLKGSPLQGNGNLDQWLPPTNLKDLIGDALDDA